MELEYQDVGVITFILCTVFALGVIAGKIYGNQDWHRDLIQRGLAEYCATTGEWAFNGECDD